MTDVGHNHDLTPLEADVLRFIYGLRGPRDNLVTHKQIHQRFLEQGFSPQEVNAALDTLMNQYLARPCKQSLARRGNWRDVTYWESEDQAASALAAAQEQGS